MQMRSSKSSIANTGSQHDFKRTLSDEELHEIFAPRDRSTTWIDVGTAGWIEKLNEAFLHDEEIIVYGQPMEAVLEFLQNQYVCRVKRLSLCGEFAPTGLLLSDLLTAVTHLNLERFGLLVESMEGSRTLFNDKGQCLVKLLEGENLTSLGLVNDGPEVEFDGLVEALESPKCHLSRLELIGGRYDDGVIHAISSLTSLESLTLEGGWDSKAAIELLATPHCNIWDFDLSLHDSDSNAEALFLLADALQNPDCKLLKLRLRQIHAADLNPFRRFCNALQSPNCKLQHLNLQLKHVSSSFLQELGNACQNAHQLTSLSLECDKCDIIPNYDLFFQSNITRLELFIRNSQYHTDGDGSEDNEHGNDVQVINLQAIPNGQMTGFLQALEHPRCRLRHLRFWVTKSRVMVNDQAINDQANIVKFLERSFGCTLETLDLRWESDSLREYCSQILKRNKIYRQGGLAHELQVEPSNAKLFICGVSEVGKTTITKNLVRRYGVSSCLQWHQSTYGIHLQPLSFRSKKLLICDLAGQKEFHAFHHYFVRGSDKDLFLVVCRAPGDGKHEEFENQLRYWLRFIVSHRTLCEHKPRVMVALNYFPTSEKPKKISMTQDAIIRCSTLIQEYSEHINFGNSNDNIFGLVATKVAQVRCIKAQVGANLGELLKNRPKIPKICQDIMNKLNKSSTPVKVISVEDFKAQFGMQDADEGLLKVSIMHLHDMGEVIYFGEETEKQLIILDVQWFLRDVVGQFLPRLQRGNASTPNALPPSSMAIAEVKSRLASQCDCEEAHIPYILSSLQRLGVLLLAPDRRSVKVLAFLRDQIDNCPGFVWKAPSCTFWGRRFQCKDSARTLLPSGIFAMLQVKLVGKYDGCRIGEGWLHLVEDGIGVIVKVGGVTGDWYDRQWIDVLVRIPFSVDGDLSEKADALFHEVKKCIFEICGAYNYGCPFIELEEKVIRPEHVENLQLTCAEVSPLAEVLREANLRADLSYRHTWPTSLQGNPVFEIMLPSERNTYFTRKSQDLKAIDDEVHTNLDQPNSSSVRAFQQDERSNELLYAFQEIVRQSENRIIDEIRRVERTVLKQMKIIQDQGDQTLAKLKLHLDFQWPRYPYISNAENVLQRFSQKVFGMSWKLHLLCEHGSCHHVADQTGITITDSPGWLADVAPVLVPTLRLLFFVGKVAAIAYVGAIPFPSPEPLFKHLQQATFSSLIEKVFGGIDESLKTTDLHRMSPKKDELERFYKKFLNGKDLADDLQKQFGLYHVTSTAHEHAWVCEEHRRLYT